MTVPADRLLDRLRAERRRFEVFRKGLVTDLDQTVTPWIITVTDGERSRRMPYINESVAVGDVVHIVDQSDPFAWADVVTVTAIPGAGWGRSDFKTATYTNSFFGFSSTTDAISGTFEGALQPSVEGDENMALFWVVTDQGRTATQIEPGHNMIATNEPVGGSYFSLSYILDITPAGGSPDTHSSEFEFSSSSNEFASGAFLWWQAHDPEQFTITEGATDFPEITAPGPDWAAVYMIIGESDETNPDGSYSFPAGVTDVTRTAAYSTLHREGEFCIGYEVSTAAGVMPTRSPTVNNNGRVHALAAMLVDTRQAS